LKISDPAHSARQGALLVGSSVPAPSPESVRRSVFWERDHARPLTRRSESSIAGHIAL
jgi:hypothetical protein